MKGWWLPPWRLRPAVVEEPVESVRSAVEVLAERDRLAREVDFARVALITARKELAQVKADELVLRGLADDLKEQLERAEARAAEPASAEAKRWKAMYEQANRNCVDLTERLAKAEGRERKDGPTHVQDPSMTGVKR